MVGGLRCLFSQTPLPPPQPGGFLVPEEDGVGGSSSHDSLGVNPWQIHHHGNCQSSMLFIANRTSAGESQVIQMVHPAYRVYTGAPGKQRVRVSSPPQRGGGPTQATNEPADL